ncbi:(2Fe-2S)-binding protein [Crateriforma conspicua]|uniref:Nitrite reductase [NAD(P)H] n=1 Tax=Crateriforma conspicua TaxID=2527996 RepID=A0A5C5Y2T4_9PLAN|nr:(2Fe-2S)-binding protein [Crateriforma conspicua]QDV63925.1 Nitrite reductase [NAD(P)H] [Crateriforma conspicua]TWT69288.1 Nitrite reductase [NAD(P)H] [Crateriforma conspicua]
MNDDDMVCLCFQVTRRKIVQFIRVEKPKRLSQLSQCYSAGTGCGWCRPFLERLMEQTDSDLPDSSAYQSGRRRHIRDKNDTP